MVTAMSSKHGPLFTHPVVRLAGSLLRRIVPKPVWLSNTSSTSRFESDPEMYAHPYASWLRTFGFRDPQIVRPSESGPQLSGYLIARRSSGNINA